MARARSGWVMNILVRPTEPSECSDATCRLRKVGHPCFNYVSKLYECIYLLVIYILNAFLFNREKKELRRCLRF